MSCRNLYSFVVYLYVSGTDLPRPPSNNLWIIRSQKVDWEKLTFSIKNY